MVGAKTCDCYLIRISVSQLQATTTDTTHAFLGTAGYQGSLEQWELTTQDRVEAFHQGCREGWLPSQHHRPQTQQLVGHWDSWVAGQGILPLGAQGILPLGAQGVAEACLAEVDNQGHLEAQQVEGKQEVQQVQKS